MALKDFDYKQFLIDKGERVALAVAGFFMALLVIFGLVINGLGSGSASANADDLTKLKDSGKRNFDNSRPPQDLVNVDPDLLRAGKLDPLDPMAFLAMNPFFVAMQAEDTKWRKPKVLATDDYQVDYVRALVRSYLYSGGKDSPKVVFLQPKNANKGASQKNAAKPKKPGRQLPGGGTLAQSGFNPYGGLQRMASGGNKFGGQGGMGGMGGMMGGRGGMRMPGMQMPGGSGGAEEERGGMAGMASGIMGAGRNAEKAELEMVHVPLERLAKEETWPPEGWPAETMVPQRMAVIQAAFPYKEQIEEFRKALRYPSLSMMEQDAEAQFAGLKVQRREMSPDGKPIGDFQELDIIESVRPLLIFGREPEDEKLLQYGLVWPKDRLVVPRPMLARSDKYPELTKLDGIKATLEVFANLEKDAPPVYSPTKFDKGFDIFESEPNEGQGNRATAGAGSLMGPMGMPGGAEDDARGGSGMRMMQMQRSGQGRMMAGAAGRGMMPPGMGAMGAEGMMSRPGAFRGGYQSMGSTAQDRLLPDKCLVRFLDVTVQPGHTYQYRVAVKMVNPLYNRPDKAIDEESTKLKELVGPWATVKQTLSVPDDVEVFVVEDKNRGRQPDAVSVQVHRWFDWMEPNHNKLAQIPVGDWQIAEREQAYRGEYIGRVEDEEVPWYNPPQEAFVFAVQAEKRRPGGRHRGIPVDFGTRFVLVDFQGGKQEEAVRKDSKIRDESPLEVLVLSPEGKLLVRNSRDDTDNPERQERLETWKVWIRKVREGKEETQMPANRMMMPGNAGAPGAGDAN